MRVCGRLPLTLVTGVRGERGRGQDSLAPNRAQAHRPAGLSVGTRLTGAVAAPAAFGVSSRLPRTKFDLMRERGPISFALIDRLLGETLCRGRSPESDTKCGLERSDRGSNAPPLGGLLLGQGGGPFRGELGRSPGSEFVPESASHALIGLFLLRPWL